MIRNSILLIIITMLIQACSARSLKSNSIHNQTEDLGYFGGNSHLPEDKRPENLIQQAKLFLETGKVEEAILHLKEALKYKSSYYNASEVHLHLGKAYVAKNDFPMAISHLRISERMDSQFESHERRKLFAISFFEEAEYYPALAALSKAYQAPNLQKDQFYYVTAAKTYLKMGNNSKNQNYLSKSLKVAEMGLREFPDNDSLREIQKECLENLTPKKVF
jgi:tetratricopeptide (TPR) repeat protein